MDTISLQWRKKKRHGVTNHQHLDLLLGRLFRRTSKKASKLCVTGLCEVIHLWPVDSRHKGPVTRKISVWWRHHVPYYWQFASRVHESSVGSVKKGPVMRKFVVFLLVSLNKLLIKQPWCLDLPLRSVRACRFNVMNCTQYDRNNMHNVPAVFFLTEMKQSYSYLPQWHWYDRIITASINSFCNE